MEKFLIRVTQLYTQFLCKKLKKQISLNSKFLKLTSILTFDFQNIPNIVALKSFFMLYRTIRVDQEIMVINLDHKEFYTN
ncbi:hypothetical protein BpHYR1_007969 [Brachionus plicatilis]|uniref:Uncharacterized protein n=1 Tax=Brachionus plicatilis TaxID=10195 RepID=A0A3M7RAG8_BRAPC|nr:hypothetical protein BpHYR1_007969 [Brachionus plicatilis]